MFLPSIPMASASGTAMIGSYSATAAITNCIGERRKQTAMFQDGGMKTRYALLFEGDIPEAKGREEEWIEQRLRSRTKPGVQRQYKDRDGRTILVSYLHLPNGGRVGISADISLQLISEKRSKDQELVLKMIGDHTPVALLITRAEDGEILFANQKASEMFKISAEHLVGIGSRSLYFDQETRNDVLKKVLVNDGVVNEVIRLKRGDGSELWGMASVKPMIFKEDNALLAVISDVTEVQNYEKQLRHRNSELLTLHRLSSIALGARSRQEALKDVVETISSATDFPHVSIELYDRNLGTMVTEGTTTRGAAERAFDDALASLVVKTGEPVIQQNLQTGSPALDDGFPDDTAYQTVASVPIEERGRVIGVLTMAHPEPEALKEYLPRWAETLANNLASIIRQIDDEQSERQNQRRFQELSDEVLEKSVSDLSDAELMELLLVAPRPEGNSQEIAQLLVNALSTKHDPSAEDVGDHPDVARFAGLLAAADEFSTRSARNALQGRPVFSSWDKLESYCQKAMGKLRKEQVRVLFLDKRNMLIKDEKLAMGAPDHVNITPRDVVRRALDLDATALVIAHNHPSGNSRPSKKDIAFTDDLYAACTTLGIALHDHLIVTRHGSSSFRDLGLLPEP